ncbi:hypothetical protein BABINDRAFT_168183 [Babjeviella inositovora NRRL Y-12698]|uniref:2'-phosphotransferase n=1 Tax=Babjeviella inositovora NRRL Y-12698 TaxID=984486 RepID=A0A1E3QL59_9ASCO|nr:uncharacterized protein BABINDRAFT_168183 [Babjeviella inositovora NRRL Y-12698]ODQ78439.1 hypothetical protein BABINDRAFT_168183 [Babjeviella inositovora NRRL Y-12698]
MSEPIRTINIPKSQKGSKPRPAKAAPNRDTLISKSLSYLLRHAAQAHGLSVDENGYIPLPEILSHNRVRSHQATLADIQRVVADCDKQRFTLKKAQGGADDNAASYIICANQGHSMKVVTNDAESLKPLTKKEDFPSAVIHGTTKDKLPFILQSGGLSRMTRNHIHFAKGLPGADGVISGMRKNCSVVIYLDIEKCFQQTEQGHLRFFESINGVILCAGDANGIVSKELFLKITDQKGNRIV